MTNKALILFVVIFFVLNTVGTYFLLYDNDFNQALIHSLISSFFVLVIFIAKRNWDKKQSNELIK